MEGFPAGQVEGLKVRGLGPGDRGIGDFLKKEQDTLGRDAMSTGWTGDFSWGRKERTQRCQ